MKKLLSVFGYVVTMALLASCGGDNSLLDPGAGTTTAQVAKVEVLVGSNTLPSDVTRVSTVDVTATVKDANNVVIQGVTVLFSAPTGSLTVTQAVTDANGVAKASISNGTDLSNRTIPISATASGISGNALVNVSGTSIKVTGPTALPQNSSGTYTVVLQDSKGIGITNTPVTITSLNTLDTNVPVTGNSGDATFTLTATTAGADNISATAFGPANPLTATTSLSVSNDIFAFTSPAQSTKINLGVTGQTITVHWTKAGVNQQNQAITFQTTRGSVSNVQPTDASGNATATVTSNNAGPAIVTATNPDGTSITLNVDFVATTVSTIDIQAEPYTVGVQQKSTITAILRDAAGNLVEGKQVNFSLQDVTGGGLSASSDTSNGTGQATVFYTGGSVSSQLGAVTVTATEPISGVTKSVSLTVAQEALFFSVGTGNVLFTPTTAEFAKEWDILATDVTGAAQGGKNLQVSLRSVNYYKGQLVFITPEWQYDPNNPPVECPDEDLNHNGILDPGEDGDVPPAGSGFVQNPYGNLNGKLEAGNIAVVAAVPDSADPQNPCLNLTGAVAANVTTNAQGLARVCVFYPQNYALWLDARISVSGSVAGTETSKDQLFLLENLATYLTNQSADPPGKVSPFGPVTKGVTTCNTPPP